MMKWLRSVIRWIKILLAKLMRRKIGLYIAGQRVDLDDQSFILWNYQMDDLSNPTIVKNSYSQQITLKGTPANNKIFGGSFQVDRRIVSQGGDVGVDFNASRKTPFTIYNEMGEILESGYVKLDSITRDGADIQYKVSLFGGLGSFFYELSYNSDGSKKTLANLDFLGGGESELDFTINATTIQDAWDALRYGTAEGTKWGVINFFPAYEGFPENFDAKHALATPASVGLPASQTGKDGNTYIPDASGYALVSLPDNYDQFAVKDLRSYLQRPAFNIKALLEAVSKPENNGGYTFDWSAIEYTGMCSPGNKWVTRPLLASLGSFKQTGGDLSTAYSGSSTATPAVVTISGVDDLPLGTQINASLSMDWKMTASGSDPLFLSEPRNGVLPTKATIVFFQAVGYDDNDYPVAGGQVQVASGSLCGLYYQADRLAEMCGYSPVYGSEFGSVVNGEFDLVSGTTFKFSSKIALGVSGYAMIKVKVHVSIYTIATIRMGDSIQIYSSEQETPFTATLFRGLTDVSASGGILTEGTTMVTYTSPQTLRSGAVFTKRSILSTAHTPAEYLLAYAKIYGFVFLYDRAQRKVSLVSRNDLYVDETIDLTNRVDVSKPVNIVPMAFSARWYDFMQEVVPGAFAQEYEQNYGRPYGMQRVNTGYDFDASTIDLLSGIALKTAVNVLESGAYFYDVTEGGNFRPAVFRDSGLTYNLYHSGAAESFDVPILGSGALFEAWSEEYPGYDVQESEYTFDKMQFHDASGKAVDGSDVLGVHIGQMACHCKLTDDVNAMDTLNGGKPCWILDPPVSTLYAPQLTRYDTEVGIYLDFGQPMEVGFPFLNYDPDYTIYARMWRKYIADRYDDDTKVMTCRVDLSGLQVGQDLMRRFFWYENSLWVLNRIKNYSLTTYDPVECEFVQVQDKDNYLIGQTY